MNYDSIQKKIPFLDKLLQPWNKLTPIQKKHLIRAFLLAVVVRIALILLAYVAARVINSVERPFPLDLNALFSIAFEGWDAIHYRHIAEHGYSAYGERYYTIAFFPLYPFLISIAALFITNIVFAGCLISFFASVAAGYLLQELIALEHEDPDMPRRGLLFFYLFPTAYFLAVPYSEALFLALVLWAFVAARRGQWFWVAIAGILASATRINGLILLPALAIDALRQEGIDTFKKAFWIFFIPLGYIVYLGINWYVMDDPVAFLGVQKAHWNQHFITPWEQIINTLSTIFNDPPSDFRTSQYESRLVAIVFTLVVLLGSIRWLGWSYQLYAWGSFVLFMGASNLISMPRYVLMIFPVFIVLARWIKHPWAVQLTTTLFTFLMGCWYIVYVLEIWAF